MPAFAAAAALCAETRGDRCAGDAAAQQHAIAPHAIATVATALRRRAGLTVEEHVGAKVDL